MAICEDKRKNNLQQRKASSIAESGLTYRHGDLEQPLPVSRRIQNFIRTLFRKEVELNKLRVVEYELDLQ